MQTGSLLPLQGREPKHGDTAPTRAADASTLLWCDLIHQLVWESEHLLGSALESLHALHREGQPLSRPMLDLRRKLESARQVSIAGRQIARLAERRASQARAESVLLSDELTNLLSQQASELRLRGVGVLKSLPAVAVKADPALVSVLAKALVSWVVAHAETEAEFRLDRPASADAPTSLMCRFRHRADAARPSRFGGPANWGAQWQLVRYAAQALGWEMRSGDDGPMSWLTLMFPAVPLPQQPTMEAIELSVEALPGSGSVDAWRVLLVSPEQRLRDAVSRARPVRCEARLRRFGTGPRALLPARRRRAGRSAARWLGV